MVASVLKETSHDAKLKSFMKLNEFHLHTDVRNQSTFYHHDGKSKSQIDYIIANDDVIESITFFDQDHLKHISQSRLSYLAKWQL